MQECWLKLWDTKSFSFSKGFPHWSEGKANQPTALRNVTAKKNHLHIPTWITIRYSVLTALCCLLCVCAMKYLLLGYLWNILHYIIHNLRKAFWKLSYNTTLVYKNYTINFFSLLCYNHNICIIILCILYTLMCRNVPSILE